jgi:hypothetical protein
MNFKAYFVSEFAKPEEKNKQVTVIGITYEYGKPAYHILPIPELPYTIYYTFVIMTKVTGRFYGKVL